MLTMPSHCTNAIWNIWTGDNMCLGTRNKKSTIEKPHLSIQNPQQTFYYNLPRKYTFSSAHALINTIHNLSIPIFHVRILAHAKLIKLCDMFAQYTQNSMHCACWLWWEFHSVKYPYKQTVALQQHWQHTTATFKNASIYEKLWHDRCQCWNLHIDICTVYTWYMDLQILR